MLRSSREHAALAPRYLGLRAVIAKSFARIHWQNLVNFGILPLTVTNRQDYHQLEPGTTLKLNDLRQQLQEGNRITITGPDDERSFEAEHQFSTRQLNVLLAGGLINWVRKQTEESR